MTDCQNGSVVDIVILLFYTLPDECTFQSLNQLIEVPKYLLTLDTHCILKSKQLVFTTNKQKSLS